MGLGDLFKANENQQLRQRVAELEALLTPELRQVQAAQQKLKEVTQMISFQETKAMGLEADLMRLQSQIAQAQRCLVETNDAVLMQEFGLYEPKYDLANSDLYKERLQKVRSAQKDMIRSKIAATGNTNWQVNGSIAQGQKMVSDMQKLLIRAYNSECDEVVSKIKFNNIDSGVKRISTSRDAISKLGALMGVSITQGYYQLKLEELYLSYEYQQKKQEEKDPNNIKTYHWFVMGTVLIVHHSINGHRNLDAKRISRSVSRGTEGDSRS